MKKNHLTLLSLLLCTLLSSLLFYSCKKDKDDETPAGNSTPATDSKITGVVKSPNGQVIGSAKIIAGTYNTITDHNGAFTLNLNPGNYNLVIQTGSGHLFKTTIPVSLAAGQVLALTPSQSVLLQTGSLAYIPGDYDVIQAIIINALGYTASAISVNDLSNYASISSYDALFLNCGALDAVNHMDSLKYANLDTYLHNHGSIYASDWAVEFLTGDGFFRMLNPGAITSTHTKNHQSINTATTCSNPLTGGLITDSSLCTAKIGLGAMVSGANVLDQDIVNVLGKNTIDINYNLPQWEMISQVNPPMNTIITHPNLGALAVKSDRFSNEYGGQIFYTTFHNEPQGTISTDVQNILQYFILNL